VQARQLSRITFKDEGMPCSCLIRIDSRRDICDRSYCLQKAFFTDRSNFQSQRRYIALILFLTDHRGNNTRTYFRSFEIRRYIAVYFLQKAISERPSCFPFSLMPLDANLGGVDVAVDSRSPEWSYRQPESF